MSIVNALMKDPEVKPENLPEILNENDMKELQTEIVGSSIVQQDLITASVAAGGPGSLNESIIGAMDLCKVSIEKLSRKTNVSKYRLRQMIYGDMDMTPKILGKIMKVFHQIRPDIYPAD